MDIDGVSRHVALGKILERGIMWGFFRAGEGPRLGRWRRRTHIRSDRECALSFKLGDRGQVVSFYVSVNRLSVDNSGDGITSLLIAGHRKSYEGGRAYFKLGENFRGSGALVPQRHPSLQCESWQKSQNCNIGIHIIWLLHPLLSNNEGNT